MKWRTTIVPLCTGCILFITGCTGENKQNEPAAANTILKDTTAVTVINSTKKSREDKILDSIQQLPFIIAAHKKIDSFSQHKNGIAFLIDSSEKEWIIQAGYNGAERFETYHRLYVNPATFEIKVYDVVNDEKLTVADYLKKDEQ